MTTHRNAFKKVPKAPEQARSCPDRGDPPPDTSSVGEAYLDTFAPPALASTSETYREVYAATRAILERHPWRHATTAVKAAYDAAAQHVQQEIGAAGGGSSC